jgi:hypothetical protein
MALWTRDGAMEVSLLGGQVLSRTREVVTEWVLRLWYLKPSNLKIYDIGGFKF